MSESDRSVCEEVPSFLRARDPSVDRCFQTRPDRQVRLFDEIHEAGQTEYAGGISSSDSKAAQVFLRLKPVENSPSYIIPSAVNVLVAAPPNDTSTSNKDKRSQQYSFSAVFDGSIPQNQVYRNCIAERIKSADSFTVLTYGTSGSGKTFTLWGTSSNPGIVPRAVEHIFKINAENIYETPAFKLVKANACILDDDALERENSLRNTLLAACAGLNYDHDLLAKTIKAEHDFQAMEQDGVSVFIWISFIEIYNEVLFDLLAPPQVASKPRDSLKIFTNDGQVLIQGLTKVYVKSSDEALKLLHWGLQRVSYASTNLNANSSRSHCVFFIDVIKVDSRSEVVETSYKFCDSAGSERLTNTSNSGSRLEEAKSINKSLMTLGRCLKAANDNRLKTEAQKIPVPVRESKLTMVLQAALLGKEKLTMIVNVTPSDALYKENINVLKYSAIAKNIICKQPPKPVYKSVNCSFVVEKEKSAAEEIVFLRSEVDRLNCCLAEKDEEINLLKHGEVERLNCCLAEKDEEINLLKRELQMQQRRHDLKIPEVAVSLDISAATTPTNSQSSHSATDGGSGGNHLELPQAENLLSPNRRATDGGSGGNHLELPQAENLLSPNRRATDGGSGGNHLELPQAENLLSPNRRATDGGSGGNHLELPQAENLLSPNGRGANTPTGVQSQRTPKLTPQQEAIFAELYSKYRNILNISERQRHFSRAEVREAWEELVKDFRLATGLEHGFGKVKRLWDNRRAKLKPQLEVPHL